MLKKLDRNGGGRKEKLHPIQAQEAEDGKVPVMEGACLQGLDVVHVQFSAVLCRSAARRGEMNT